MNADTKNLVSLYQKSSKHSNYQAIPPSLSTLLPKERLQIESRHESARWEFIDSHCTLNRKKIVDIGGNTGYFSFRSIEAGAESVCLIEGNEAHAEFVRQAAKSLGISERLAVLNQYLDLANSKLNFHVDYIFLLNVLHHAGDDYDKESNTPRKALEKIKKSLENLSGHSDQLIFQIGFNWKGDRNRPLFPDGTKAEMIEFVKECLGQKWTIKSIGIAQKKDSNEIFYQHLNEKNIIRDDSLGEFLNRPIFIIEDSTKTPRRTTSHK